MNKTALLTEFVKSVLLEDAKKIEHAENDQLAIYAGPTGHSTVITIYKPSFYLNLIEQIAELQVSQYPPDKLPKVMSFMSHRLSNKDGIVGMIILGKSSAPCWGASTVRYAAAIDKYGPLIYDIAFDLAPDHTLIPDRRSVSQDAGKVWNYYKTRRGDIKAKKLDDIENPKTPPTEDDCKVFNDPDRPEIDYAYSGQPSVNTHKLEREHAIYVKDARDKIAELKFRPLSGNRIEEMLASSAQEFFDFHYAKGQSAAATSALASL